MSCDTFDCADKDFSYEDYLNSDEKFDIKKYRRMSKEDKKLAYLNCGDTEKYMAKSGLEIAFDLKESLDKLYGRDNYVFVSVGRSSAPVARIFEFSGVETKYLPISGLAPKKEYLENVQGIKGLDEYKNILNMQGMDKKSMLKSTKKYLFYDYTKNGTSLNIVKKIMEDAYGLPKRKMEFRSLNEDILQSSKNEDSAIDYINFALDGSLSELVGGIARLSCEEFDAIHCSKEHLSRGGDLISKNYNFLIINSLCKYKQLRYNPLNASCL